MRRLPIFVTATLVILAAAGPARAQGKEGFAAQNVYIGVSPNFHFTLGGSTFDGLTEYRQVGGQELFILPRLDKQDAFRGIVGFRAPIFALEFSYDRTNHHGTFDTISTKASFNSVNIDARVFFATHGRIQPYILFGITFPWLTIQNGSTLSGAVGDATFRGQGLDTEAGVTAFATSRIGISVGYAYRPIWFNRVRGVGNQSFQLVPRFRESSNNVVMMAFVTL